MRMDKEGISQYKAAKLEIASALADAVKADGNDADVAELELTIDAAKGFGDLSSTIALKLAKKTGGNAQEIAARIADGIKCPSLVERVTAENGFVNFHLSRPNFAEAVLGSILELGDAYTGSRIGAGKKAIVEYPSVNPVHPWHVGQVRSAILGDSIANMMEACGYSVQRIDYVDDLGLQVAEVIWGMQHLDQLGVSRAGKRADYFIGEVYVAVNKLMKERDLEAEIKNVLALMERQGTRESQASRSIAEEYVRAEYDTAFEFGMYHDLLVWESDIIRNRVLERAMDILKDTRMIKRPADGKYAGCTIIDLNEIGDLPKEFRGLREDAKVLFRSNGTPNYLAKDIAFHMWKFGIMPDTFRYGYFITEQPNGKPLYTTAASGAPMEFGDASVAVNTIDVRQYAEQAMVHIALDAAGYKDKAAGFKHLAYGIVTLESGALAGRKGTWVGYTADDLLREARDKAAQLIGERFRLSDEQRSSIARSIALSAIRFEFLRLSCEKELVFSWSRALNFEGNSGPYCEYMHARAMRLLEDSGVARGSLAKPDGSLISSDVEFELVKLLAIGRDIIEKACREYRPNIITEYMSDLAAAFSKFYEQRPVLRAEDARERLSRLCLVEGFRTVMRSAMRACGIEPVSRM